jgi:hypothetical protein
MPQLSKMKPRRRCHCRVCKDHRMINSTIATGSRQQIKRVVWEILSCLEAESTDATVSRCILNGTWTDSVRILTAALARAQAQEKLEAEKEEARRALRKLTKTVEFGNAEVQLSTVSG